MRPSMGRCAVRHQCKFRSRMNRCRSWCQLWQEAIHSQQDREERNVCTGIMIRRARGRAEIEAGGSPPAGRDRGVGFGGPQGATAEMAPRASRQSSALLIQRWLAFLEYERVFF